MEATTAVQPDTSSKTEATEPLMVILIFSCVGLAISSLAARYGLEVDPALFRVPGAR
jgi:hypothetical protein